MNEVIKEKYAQLLLEVGVNLQEGQKLVVSAEPYHWDFLTMLAEKAYAMGASYVHVDAEDPRMLEARVKHSGEQYLEDLPSWLERKGDVMIDEDWARLRIFGPTDMKMLESLDDERLGSVQKAASLMAKPVMEHCAVAGMSWCVAALPTPGWASMVFGEEPSSEVEHKLWRELVKILSLDADDPCAIWREKGDLLKIRCEVLQNALLDRVEFRGPGTELSVGMLDASLWLGGAITKPSGIEFQPNIPTEEVFSTPDYQKTEGRVQVVKPVEVLGKLVEGAWFVFKEGKVVDYGATRNEEALDRYFKTCPQAAYLGEVALVDSSSPIDQSGLVFHSILYDENATSHIALGSGYPMAVRAGESLSKEEKLARGLNVSLVHTDFMIGGSEVEVTGYDRDGNEWPIIREGKFVIGR